MTSASLQIRKRGDKTVRRERDDRGKLLEPYPLAGVDLITTPEAAAFSESFVASESQLGWLELVGSRFVSQDWVTASGSPGTWRGIHADAIVLHTLAGTVEYDVIENPGRVEDASHPAGYRVEHQFTCILSKAPKAGPKRSRRPIAGGADFVFNISLGRFVYYCTLPATSDALIVVLLKASAADASARDFDDLAALLAGTADEADFTNYTRKTVSSITVTVDDTNERTDVDIADQTWTSAGGGTNNTLTDLLMTYDNDTGAGTDSAIVPMTQHDFAVTTDGSDLTAQIAAAGFGRAAG
jgi:hypothetical protein